LTASLISPIAYLATREDKLPLLFVSERGQPMTRQAVNYLIREAGERAKLGRVWPHMLRHSAGYALSNRGTDFRVLQDFLGHRDPRDTRRATRGRPVDASRGLWRLSIVGMYFAVIQSSS
jgi:site-specific recombinase XerD